LTVEANALLSDAYNYLKNKTSSIVIKRDYDGVSLARAVTTVSNRGSINLDEIFSSSTGEFNPYGGSQDRSGGCKLWQLDCNFESIFGVSIWGVT
jgi:hypothetical protein